MKNNKNLPVPNDRFSEILLYTTPNGKVKVEIFLHDENIWLSQEKIAALFGVQRPAITKHLKNIFESGELDEKMVSSILELTSQHGAIIGKTQTNKVTFYNLDTIISVGYRVNSSQATQFRIWATERLKEYIIKGFALNSERFKSGNSMSYFNELQEKIREIRLSERFFYQKIKDIYTTSIDYDPRDEKTIEFFKIVQNKLLWAISKQTAAELVYRRVDASLPHLGMRSFDKEASFAIRKTDVSIAKNYLNEDEIKLLGLIVEQYLAFAEAMAQQRTPMHMKDWIARLDAIINLNGRELLQHAGEVSHEMALEKSSSEYQKYKETQKQLEREISFKELEKDIADLEKRLPVKGR